MDAKLQFHKRLESLGIPIDGIAGEDGPDARIDFRPEATKEQIELANSEKKSFEWDKVAAEPEPESPATLSNEKFKALLNALNECRAALKLAPLEL